MQNFICLPWSAADEILPPVVSCAQYLLAAHARHSPYPCRKPPFYQRPSLWLSPASSRIFLCLVSCASPHLRQDRAVPLKHANPSCIKFSFFAMLASCRTLSCLSVASRRRLISQPHMPRIHTALVVSSSGRALKFQPKSPIWRRVRARTISSLVRRRGLNFVSRSLFPLRAQGS